MKRSDVVDLDKRHLWHPYTAMSRYIAEVDPFVIERAEGPYLYDADGARYLDANSSWWVAALGHGHPRLVGALSDQAARLAHTSLAGVTHEPAARLAARMAEIAPSGLTRVFFSDDGSTALEAAIKMALGFHDQTGKARRLFVSMGGAFHGETLGVTALGGVSLFRDRYRDVLMEVAFVDPPRDEADLGRATAELAALFDARGSEIAGFVIEPLVQGAAGMRVYPSAYLRAARAITRAHGALLIDDEVFTGYGRTGTFWAIEQAGVLPDLLCTAKAFSGGMLPMAATLASEAVFDAFSGAPERAFYYGHSFCGNPLGARVALEVLDVYRDEGVLAGVPERAAKIDAAFRRLAELPGATNPRALGMIGAIDLCPEGRDASYLGQTGWRAHAIARTKGAYLRPLGDVVYVAPPINIPLAALDELLEIVTESVRGALS